MKCRDLSIIVFLVISSPISLTGSLSDNLFLSQNSGDTFGILLETANLWLGLPEERNAMVLAKLPEGTKVKILERTERYYRVMHKTLIGYLDQQVVGLVGENLREFQPNPETSADEESSLPEPESVNIPKPPLNNQEAAYFLTKATSLRAAPDSKAKVYLRFAPEDKVLTVLDKSDRYWWQVEYKGQIGWVKCALLEKR